MRAVQLAVSLPTVSLDTPAHAAARLLASRDLPGLIVVDAHGRPLTVLPGTQVLQFAVPTYIIDDPALARVVDETTADLLLRELGERTVAQCLPEQHSELPVVGCEATLLEVAALMARARSPLVAVVDADGALAGAITLERLMDQMMGTS